MANWSNPLLTSTYTNFLTEVKDRDTDLALQFDGTTSTNIPTNTIRWNSSINRWQKWSGSAWGELTATYALTALTTTTTVTATGNVSGAALVPSSATIPVAGIFLPAANTLAFATATTERLRIDSSGRVGIGTSSPQAALHVNGTELRVETSATSEGFVRFVNASGSMSFGMSGAVGNAALLFDRTNNQSAYIYTGGASGSHAWSTNNIERMRIDSSGRLLVGTSSSLLNHVEGGVQLQGTVGDAYFTATRYATSSTGSPGLVLGRSRSGTKGANTIVAAEDRLGEIVFTGADGSGFVNAATIQAFVDGTPGANDMPGRLVFSTTADGAASPTERLRITNDGVQAYNRPAPAAVNATATLTVANLKAGIITSTSAAATDMTLPTGTDTQAGFSGTYDNFTFEWSVINTGPSLVRVLAGTAHTVVGSGSVATGTSGRFASRRTAANTFVTYRLT